MYDHQMQRQPRVQRGKSSHAAKNETMRRRQVRSIKYGQVQA